MHPRITRKFKLRDLGYLSAKALHSQPDSRLLRQRPEGLSRDLHIGHKGEIDLSPQWDEKL